MSGYLRQGRPNVDPALPVISVATFISEETINRFAREADPFNLADPCPANAGAPHYARPSCGDLACMHCGKVFW